MKKFKTLSLAFVGASLLSVAGPLRPAFAESYVTLDSTTVNISSSMITGATQLLAATNNPAYVALYAPATASVTGEKVCIGPTSSVSTNTTSGSFRFPVNTVFELRDYKGPLWAIAEGTTPVKVSVLRKR